ncbi:MAG: site-specific DNA-methyltransferase [Firmicutes bacterium]|nr:site-specific DNA-methyltransferase [Bacillota bacterium]
MQTTHRLFHADARDMSFIPDNSVHLVVTSPPYWNLKEYERGESQLGIIEDYEQFVDELVKVWKECYRILVPGGRVVCVVGDVCLSRRKYGRHVVMPLHSDIAVSCRKIGFDNLNPILWHKVSNATFEANNCASFLGKPYEPNAIIKNDMEYILMQRKPGGYRAPTNLQREKSRIAKTDYDDWFKQIWTLGGASTKKHPAPFPLELATRLVKMFSFYGDTVIDPFCGSGTTMQAALISERNSIGIEVEEKYCRMIENHMDHNNNLFSKINFQFIPNEHRKANIVNTDPSLQMFVIDGNIKSHLEKVENV